VLDVCVYFVFMCSNAVCFFAVNGARGNGAAAVAVPGGIGGSADAAAADRTADARPRKRTRRKVLADNRRMQGRRQRKKASG